MIRKKRIIYQVLPRLFGPRCNNEVFNGSIDENGCGKFNDLNHQALAGIKELGITDLWLTGILRHATATAYPEHQLEASHPDLLKGKAGSPYAVKDYYDVDPDLAENIPDRMKEFDELITRAGENDLGVIIDFVPNHVSRDYNSIAAPSETESLGENDDTSVHFSRDNNYYYLPNEALTLPGTEQRKETGDHFNEFPAKVTGNDVFHSHPQKSDWYETVKINYGIDFENNQAPVYPIPDTWSKMRNILLFWANKGIAGFRCDMAGMVPAAFWEYAIAAVKTRFPQLIFIAELYEPTKYQEYLDAGFDYLYDKVGMYDAVREIITRQASTERVSALWKSLNGLDNHMLRFTENHDEQRIASDFYAGDAWKGLPALALAALMHAGPVLIYFGQEVGESAKGAVGFSGDDGRTSIFDYTCLPELKKWGNQGNYDGHGLAEAQKKLRLAHAKILHFSQAYPVFVNGGFYDLMWFNEDLPQEIRSKVFAFLRYTDADKYLIAISFDPLLSAVKIKIGNHAFQTMGTSDADRFTINYLHPVVKQSTLLLSQITDRGIDLHFDHTGWSVIKINTGSKPF